MSQGLATSAMQLAKRCQKELLREGLDEEVYNEFVGNLMAFVTDEITRLDEKYSPSRVNAKAFTFYGCILGSAAACLSCMPGPKNVSARMLQVERYGVDLLDDTIEEIAATIMRIASNAVAHLNILEAGDDQ